MKKKGFTLIEVLIVIIIVGILATLVMPRIGGMLERARSAEAKNTMAAIRTILMAEYIETESFQLDPTATTIAALEVRLGDVVTEGAAQFNYTYLNIAASDPPAVTIYSERNAVKWTGGTSSRAKLKMVVYGDGSADDIVTTYATGTPPTAGDTTDNTW